MIQKLCVYPGPGHAVFLCLLPLGMEWGLSKVVNLRVNMPNSHHTLFQSWLRKASSPSTWTLKGGSKPFPVPKAEEVRFQPERVRPSPGKQPVWYFGQQFSEPHIARALGKQRLRFGRSCSLFIINSFSYPSVLSQLCVFV